MTADPETVNGRILAAWLLLRQAEARAVIIANPRPCFLVGETGVGRAKDRDRPRGNRWRDDRPVRQSAGECARPGLARGHHRVDAKGRGARRDHRCRSVFSAGVDLRALADGGAEYAGRFVAALSEAFLAVFDHPAPVVAAINGHAIAGGCVLAMCADVRLMSGGTIGLTELRSVSPSRWPRSKSAGLRWGIGGPGGVAGQDD